jgi:tetratricopeptide (TPR) repeat protein
MLYKALISAALLLFAVISYAQTADELVEQAKQQEKQYKEAAALSTYKDVLKIQSDNVAALTGAAELSAREGSRQEKKGDKATFYTDALGYAQQALKLAPENADANYAMADVLSRQALILGTKDKVAAYKDLKRYAELALKFNPNYARAFYLLGHWNYEITNLNALEKAAAKALFGGLPAAGLDDAISNYERARKLDASYLPTYLELAKAYKQHDEQDKTIEVLKKAVTLRNVYQDDAAIKAECKKMLDDLQ